MVNGTSFFRGGLFVRHVAALVIPIIVYKALAEVVVWLLVSWDIRLGLGDALLVVRRRINWRLSVLRRQRLVWTSKSYLLWIAYEVIRRRLRWIRL